MIAEISEEFDWKLKDFLDFVAGIEEYSQYGHLSD